MLICFLQNAWSPLYSGDRWPRASWLRALARSRSGQRLRIMLDDLSCCENLTPIVGDNPDSIVPPDREHIQTILERKPTPTLIVACGTFAELTLKEMWGGPLLAVPHPANRILTNALYKEAKQLIASGFAGRAALRQLRGRVALQHL